MEYLERKNNGRRNRDWWRLGAIVSSVLFVAVAPWSAALGGQAQPANSDDRTAAYEKPLVYAPPMRGAPDTRVGGATRSLPRLKAVEILAPAHTGLTVSENPTLYWYVSEPGIARVELALRDADAFRTILFLSKTVQAGIHALTLAKHNLNLAVDAEYRLSVTLVPDTTNPSIDLSANGRIRRVSAEPALVEKLSQQPGSTKFYAYAEEGIFFDAVDELSKGIALSDDDHKLRDLRASLLDQIGLSRVAEYDRRN